MEKSRYQKASETYDANRAEMTIAQAAKLFGVSPSGLSQYRSEHGLAGGGPRGPKRAKAAKAVKAPRRAYRKASVAKPSAPVVKAGRFCGFCGEELPNAIVRS